MIIGIGSDIVQIPRIEKLINKFGYKFISRIYTDIEIYNSKKYKNNQNRINYFAKRYAAKEAFVKALGTGIRNGIRFTDIEITNNELGRPIVKIYNMAADFLKKLEINYKIEVTLSDDYPVALAFIIIIRSN